VARIFNRGQHIPFRHSFYDTSGDLASPTSVALTISYPTSGWPFNTCRETTTLSMTQSTEGSTHAEYLTWASTWASGQAYPGPVYWSIRSDDLSLSVSDGSLILRGNEANLTITTTS
jgi:hypothetical protein